MEGVPLFPLQMKNPPSERRIDTAVMLTIIATLIRSSFFFLTLLGEPGEQITSDKFDHGLGCTYNVHMLLLSRY